MDRARNPVLFNSPPSHFYQNYQQPHLRNQPPQFSSVSPDFRPDHKPQSSNLYYRQETQKRFPPQHPRQQGQQPMNKQKFKEMTDDLAKLKQQLQSIMTSSSGQKLRSKPNYNGNKSSDNLFAPHARVDEFQIPKFNLEENGSGNLKNVLRTNERGAANEKFKVEQSRQEKEKFSPKQQTVFREEPLKKDLFFDNDKKNRFLSHNPVSNSDRKMAFIQNPNVREAAKRENLAKEQKEKQQKQEKQQREYMQQRQRREQRQEKSDWKKQAKEEKYPKQGDKEQNVRKIENSERRNSRYQIGAEKVENSQRKGSRYQLEQIKTEMQSQIDKLALQKSNLLQLNQNLTSDLQKAKLKLVEIQDRKKILEEENQFLKSKQATLQSKLKSMEESLKEHKSDKNEKRESFDHVLIDQLQETAKFRELLEQKSEEIARLNDIILLNQRKAEEAINEGSIQKLKYLSELKQQQQTFDIKSLALQNEIKSLRHAMETLAAKLKAAVRENKSKDDFLQQHLVGRLKSGEEQEYVKNFLKKYEVEFPFNNILTKLLEEQKIIRELRERLGEREI